MIDFLGEKLHHLSRGAMGPWTSRKFPSQSGWCRVVKRIPVPPRTLDAIMTVGLLGATGTLDVDGFGTQLIPRGGEETTNLIRNSGFELGENAEPPKAGDFRKLPSEGQARTGAYKTLVEGNHDLTELHALMSPRPFLVSGGTADLPERWPALNHAIAVNRLLGYENRVGMTNREGHSPTEQANEQVYRFFVWWLKERK